MGATPPAGHLTARWRNRLGAGEGCGCHAAKHPEEALAGFAETEANLVRAPAGAERLPAGLSFRLCSEQALDRVDDGPHILRLP